MGDSSTADAHVFISYVRNNKRLVQRLCGDLTKHGVKVWLDRKDIDPGVYWKRAIRKAIQDGAFFIACFSKQYNQRPKTYMNEELALAIDILRQRAIDQSWFIPVKLNRCEIPEFDIGAGKILQDIEYVELYKAWNAGIERILNVIQPIPKGIHEDQQFRHPIPRISCHVSPTPSDPFHLYFHLKHHGGSSPTKVLVDATIYLGSKKLGYPMRDTGHYSGSKEWNMNPGMVFRGHFKVPQKAAKSTEKLKIVVTLTVIDHYNRPHKLLPFKWVYNRDKEYWAPEP